MEFVSGLIAGMTIGANLIIVIGFAIIYRKNK